MPFTLTKTVRQPTRITDLCDIKQTRHSTEYEALCYAGCERDDDYVVTLTNDENRDCRQSLGNVPLVEVERPYLGQQFNAGLGLLLPFIVGDCGVHWLTATKEDGRQIQWPEMCAKSQKYPWSTCNHCLTGNRAARSNYLLVVDTDGNLTSLRAPSRAVADMVNHMKADPDQLELLEYANNAPVAIIQRREQSMGRVNHVLRMFAPRVYWSNGRVNTDVLQPFTEEFTLEALTKMAERLPFLLPDVFFKKSYAATSDSYASTESI